MALLPRVTRTESHSGEALPPRLPLASPSFSGPPRGPLA